jgi:competence protein ComEA
MKQFMYMTIILMIIGWIIFFPRPKKIEYVHQGKEDINMIVVEISGAVEFPGVYHFFEPLTINEALKYAGKTLDDADLSSIMTSEMITRNRSIYIKSINLEQVNKEIYININKASFKELITIPHMTENRAISLLLYREQHGNFVSIDDLIHVKNIGLVTLEKIKPYIYI